MAEEILAAVPHQVAGVRIVPVTGGRFEMEIDDQRVFDIQEAGGFPKTGEAAAMVRTRLGTQDRSPPTS